MRLIDADDILGCGFSQWLGCVLCGQATKEHPSCDGSCDMQARIYADKAADALAIWLAEVPTIDAEPVRHGYWISDSTTFFYGTKRIERGDVVPIIDGSPVCSCYCSVCGEWLVGSDEYAALGNYCPSCGAKMTDEVSE